MAICGGKKRKMQFLSEIWLKEPGLLHLQMFCVFITEFWNLKQNCASGFSYLLTYAFQQSFWKEGSCLLFRKQWPFPRIVIFQ